jgi:hypothetical protein
MPEKPEEKNGIFARIPKSIHRELVREAGKESRSIGGQIEAILKERYKDVAKS